MTSNDNGVLPSGYRLGDTVQNNWFTEDSTTEDVSDSTIRAPPHLLQLELFDTSLIRSDGRALDTDAILENCFRGFDCYFIASLDSA